MIRSLIYIILIGALCVTSLQAFIYLPYTQYDNKTFNVNVNYIQGAPVASELDVLTASQDSLNKVFGSANIAFAFKNFGFGIGLYPVRLEILNEKLETTANAFDFYWSPGFLKFPDFFDTSIQLGSLNMGIMNTLKDSVFSRDIRTTYVTTRFRPLSSIPHFYTYVSSLSNFQEGDKYITSLGLSWEYSIGYFRIEKYYDLVLLTASLNTSNYSKISIMVNPSLYKNESADSNIFKPSVGIGLGFQGYFMNPRIVHKPIDVDDEYLSYTEKGLVCYYDEDYDQALFYYLKVIKEYPDFPLAHTRLGDIYYKLNMPNKAMYHWKEVLKYDSNNYTVIRAIKNLEEEFSKNTRI